MLTLILAAVLCQADPIADIAALKADVMVLADAGELRPSYGKILTAFCDYAAQRVAQGRSAAAAALLKAFVAYTSKFAATGNISSESAQSLIDAAYAIMADLGG